MAIAQALVYKVYTGLAGSVATVATHRLLTSGWHFVTGEEPPEPTDPDADARSAVIWALASAAGLAATQVIARRIGYRYLQPVDAKKGKKGKKKGKVHKISVEV